MLPITPRLPSGAGFRWPSKYHDRKRCDDRIFTNERRKGTRSKKNRLRGSNTSFIHGSLPVLLFLSSVLVLRNHRYLDLPRVNGFKLVATRTRLCVEEGRSRPGEKHCHASPLDITHNTRNPRISVPKLSSSSLPLHHCIRRGDERSYNRMTTFLCDSYSSDNNKQDPDDDENSARRPMSSRRVGGRAEPPPPPPSQKNINNPNPNSNEEKTLFQTVKVWGVGLLGLWVALQFLKGLLGFGGSDVVYYSSSYYESQTYDSNGRVQVDRREEIRSNIPGLKEQIRVNNLRDGTSNQK